MTRDNLKLLFGSRKLELVVEGYTKVEDLAAAKARADRAAAN